MLKKFWKVPYLQKWIIKGKNVQSSIYTYFCSPHLIRQIQTTHLREEVNSGIGITGTEKGMLKKGVAIFPRMKHSSLDSRRFGFYFWLCLNLALRPGHVDFSQHQYFYCPSEIVRLSPRSFELLYYIRLYEFGEGKKQWKQMKSISKSTLKNIFSTSCAFPFNLFF